MTLYHIMALNMNYWGRVRGVRTLAFRPLGPVSNVSMVGFDKAVTS